MSAQVLGRVALAFASWGTLMVATQVLDPAGVGIFDSYLALYILLDVFVDGGSGMALLRRASAAPDSLRPTLRRALGFRWVTSALATAIALACQALDPRVGLGNPWALLSALTFLCHLPGALSVVFHLRLQFGYPTAARTVAGVASFLAILILAAAGKADPILFLFVWLLSRVAANLAIAWRAWSLLREYPAGSSAEPGFLRESLTLGLGGLLREGYARMDVLLLRWFLGPEAAGLYAPARRTLSLALQFPSFLMTVAAPPMAARAVDDPSLFRRRVWTLAMRLGLFAVPAALLSLPLVTGYLAWFGADYEYTADALRLLAFAAAAAWPGMALLTALVTSGRARDALLVSAAALGLNLFLNLLLIPDHGQVGAAQARVAAEILALAAAAALFWRRGGAGRHG